MTESSMLKNISNQLENIESRLNSISGDEKWLNIKQVCERSSVSKSTILREIKRGKLKVSRRVGRLLFSTNDVKKWLDG